jgi:hypothetical protein
VRGAVPALFAALVIAAACGTSPAVAAAGAKTPVDHAHMIHSIQSGPPRIWTLQGGEWVPIANGTEVTVGGIQVQVWLTPFPPGRKAVVHFQLSRDRLPVEGAVLVINYDHEAMEHGPFTVTASSDGPGHFEAPLEFIMAGRFWIDATIRTDRADAMLKLLVQTER